MKKLYRIKVSEAKAKELNKKKNDGASIIDGYLASYGKINTYTRHEAVKKAGWFDGTIELVQSDVAKHLTNVTLQQIGENVLLAGVIKALSGREAFNDADPDNSERIYHGDVFEAILGEDAEMPKTSVMKIKDKAVLNQLEELATYVDADYLQIVN